MRVSWIVAAAVACATSAFAMSDIEIRDNWSKAIVAVKKNECAGESKKVHKLMDYAAILIVHNETEEAGDVLLKAAGESESKACGEAIKSKLKP